MTTRRFGERAHNGDLLREKYDPVRNEWQFTDAGDTIAYVTPAVHCKRPAIRITVNETADTGSNELFLMLPTSEYTLLCAVVSVMRSSKPRVNLNKVQADAEEQFQSLLPTGKESQ